MDALYFHPDSGVFLWKTPRANGRIRQFSVAGTIRRDGYIEITVCRERWLAHRLAWAYVYGDPVPSIVDHIDGDKQNNRIANLRPATSALSNLNKRPARGVWFDQKRRSWKAYIGKKTLGYFSTEAGAAQARAVAYEDALEKAVRESLDG